MDEPNPKCLDCSAELSLRPGVFGLDKLRREIPALVCPADGGIFTTQADGTVVRLGVVGQ